MIVKPIDFIGCCCGCNRNTKHKARGGVEVGIQHDDNMGDYMCLSCANGLADRLHRAISKCRELQSQGKEYRHDKWVMKGKQPSTVEVEK